MDSTENKGVDVTVLRTRAMNVRCAKVLGIMVMDSAKGV